jgi:hypothetical protein
MSAPCCCSKSRTGTRTSCARSSRPIGPRGRQRLTATCRNSAGCRISAKRRPTTRATTSSTSHCRKVPRTTTCCVSWPLCTSRCSTGSDRCSVTGSSTACRATASRSTSRRIIRSPTACRACSGCRPASARTPAAGFRRRRSPQRSRRTGHGHQRHSSTAWRNSAFPQPGRRWPSATFRRARCARVSRRCSAPRRSATHRSRRIAGP